MIFFRLLVRAAKVWISREAGVHAAALAYFIPFALTPLFLLSITIVGLLIGGNEVTALLLSWGNAIDPEVTSLLDSSVRNFNRLTTAYVVPIIAILFFSTMIIVALNSFSSALHRLWEVQEIGWRIIINRTVRSFLFVILLQVYLVWIIMLNRTGALLVDVPFFTLLQLLYPFILFGSTVLLITIGYGLLPVKSPRFKARLYGALVASIFFFFSRMLVSLQTETSPIPDVFGAAGLIILLLVWIYVAASIVLYGAAFAWVYEQNKQLATTKQ